MITRSLRNPNTQHGNDLVVVLHGFCGNRLLMLPLCGRLRSHGFQVNNWGYNSLHGSIESHAARFRSLLDNLAAKPSVHIVAYSMGAAVVRAALAGKNVSNLGRIVFIAPPNSGTPVARFVERVLAPFCKPIGELSSRADSFVNMLPDAGSYEAGILAAQYDILVPTANSHLQGEMDHLTLRGTHSSLLLSKRVGKEVATFLTTGKFSNPKTAAQVSSNDEY